MTSSYDVEFITPDRTEGFILMDVIRTMASKARDREYQGGFGPAELQPEVVKSRDIPVLWDDISAGMGFSQRWGDIPGIAYARNAYCRSPRLIMPAAKLFPVVIDGSTILNAGGPVATSVHWGGKLLFFAQGKIIGIAPGTPLVATTISTLASTQFVKAQIFRGAATRNLYISDALGQLVRQTLANAGTTTWDRMGAGTPSRFLDMAQVYQAQGDKSGWQLYAVDGLDPTKAWHVTGDPFVAGNWSGPLAIGSGYPIRKLMASRRHTYYICDDGVFDLDENGYSPNLVSYYQDFPNDQNGQYAAIYNGAALVSNALGLDRVPLGQGLLNDVDGYCHPGVGLPNETPVYGPVTAGLNEGGWQVIAQWNGTDSYICYGKERRVLGIDGPGPFVWYPELYIPGEKVTHMTLDNQNGQNLGYIFTQPGGTGTNIKAYAYTIPDGSPLQDWLNGGKHRFADTWEVYLPSEDWKDSAAKKTLMRYDTQTDGLGHLLQGDVSIAIDARVEEGSWIRQGSSNISPRSTIYPVGQYLTGYRIQTRISGISIATGAGITNVTYPAVVRSLKARAGLIIEERATRLFRLKLSTGELRNGGIDTRDMDELAKWVYGLQNYGPITIRQDNVEMTAKVESGATWIEMHKPREGTATKETIIELTVSIIEQTPAEPALIIPQYTGPTWSSGSGAGTGSEPTWGDGTVRPGDITWQG